MRRIFKYPLVITDEQEVELPVGAEVISALNQRGQLVLYAIVDDSVSKTEKRIVRIFGTGHVVDVYHGSNSEYDFIGTVSMMNDELIWHVFVKKALIRV